MLFMISLIIPIMPSSLDPPHLF